MADNYIWVLHKFYVYFKTTFLDIVGTMLQYNVHNVGVHLQAFTICIICISTELKL